MKTTPECTESRYVAKAYWKWLKECELSKSPHTVRAYEVSIRLYMDYLEETGIDETVFTIENDFSRDKILQWLEWLRTGKGSSAETCNNRLAHIRTFLEYLSGKSVKYKHLFFGAKDIKPFRCVKKKQNAIEENALKILMRTPDRETRSGCVDIMMMSFLYGTAVRVGEMRMVQLKDLNLTDGTPYVHIVGKGNKERNVYLPSKIVTNLKNYISLFHGEGCDGDAYLFFSRVKGKHYPISEAAIDKRLKNVAKKAHERDNSIPASLHAHQFRRTRATTLSNKGLNPFQIAKILGHEQLETTMKYVDVGLPRKEKDLMALEDDETKKIKPVWKEKGKKMSDSYKRTRT